ncbi:hypothetical protein KEM60_01232 [Austwickia sp. TVS 96-490-7B]|uniref:RHS repeat-associated core domain-containing protein n=1 Tax=Austwickia sp. TVS 96-490-7B TaxID=2830843 RepID=UPI001C59BA42|nr:RHS repeat-associated core domain-containing protein [Austwickia sp. TVS 96-490-7B]MBW3085040.1 hypothetical protein [Austwickia sp. TVS 96-490-7B]
MLTSIKLGGGAASALTYDKNGNEISAPPGPGGVLAARNVHRYVGGIYEPATGLTRFGVRWYNPATGRFTTPDPSGKEKNNYLYASGNACNRTDPSGEECTRDQAIALGVTGIVVGVVGVVVAGVGVAGLAGIAAVGTEAAGVATMGGLITSVMGLGLSIGGLACTLDS